MLKEILEGVKAEGADLSIFAHTNRSLYDQVPEFIRTDCLKEAEKISGTSWPFITAGLFREFSINGDRENFQKPYFEKRRRLSAFVSAAALCDDGSYIADVEEGVWSLLSEPAWVIPAHNSYIRDTTQLPLPDITRPILDLFACETGEILALTAITVGDLIDPTLLKDIKAALRTRILIPYLTDHFWWMGDKELNNWSPWCTQNVLITTAALDLSEKEQQKVLRQAVKTLDQWLSEYGEDGCCNEGAHYWHAAGLCFSGCLSLLAPMTGGRSLELFRNSKVRNIAAYIGNVHVEDDIYLNFADCSPKPGRLGAREFLFARQTGLPSLMDLAASDFRKEWWEDDNFYNLYYRLLALGTASEIMAYQPSGRISKPAFTWYPSTGLAIYREGKVTLAVKAGGNNDSHNHNDTGSITLYKGKKALLLDIGVETYTRTTFSAERYTLLPMQSLYHNTVNFPPHQQAAGAEYKAERVEADNSGISMDLKHTFPAESEVIRLERKVSAPEKGIIKVTDEARCRKASPVLTLMTLDKPQIEDCKLQFPHFSISFSGPVRSMSEEFPVADARLRKAWPDMLYRTLVYFEDRLEWTINTKEKKR